MTGLLRKIYNTTFDYETRLWLYKLRHPAEYRTLRSKVYPSEKGDFSLRPYDQHQCIFVHITKTAGTSVAKSLFGFLPYHYTAIDYRVIYSRKTFKHYYKFAFVRNPWDRLYSAYRYLKAGGWNEDDRIWCDAHLANYHDFNTFVLEWLSHENIKKHIHFKPQFEFICDSQQNILIDYLAYFETINDDFTKIADKLGIDTNIGHHNANPANHYSQIYSAPAIQKVADIYADDIRLFGYDFDGIKNRTVIQSNHA